MSLEHTDKIEWVDINRIKLNPKNTNKHPKDQIERLAKIINYQGWRSPLVVANKIGNQNANILAAGEGRYLAAKELGLSKVPVNYQEFTDQDQFTAYVTSDNSIAAWADLDFSAINESIGDFDHSFDLDLLGIKDFEVTPEDKYEDKEADEVPDVNDNEYNVKLGDIYQLGDHRLMCGDSTCEETVAKLMNGEKADMVFTDPPYGMNLDTDYSKMDNGIRKSNKHKKVIGDDKEFNFNLFYNQFLDVEEQFWFGADYYCDKIPKNGSWIVWDKTGGYDSMVSAGFSSNFELCWSRKLHKREILKVTWKGCFGHNKKDDGPNRVHPTMKPVKLCELFFNKFSKNDGEKIVDLFLGSGSTLIACEKTNRKCYGMELDPHYCSVIIKRWEQFTGQKHQKLTP